MIKNRKIHKRLDFYFRKYEYHKLSLHLQCAITSVLLLLKHSQGLTAHKIYKSVLI